MTIQGAIAELQNLLNANDVPFYYKGGIQKVIETIQMELVERNAKLEALERRINLHEKAMAKVIVHKMIDDAVIAEDAYPDLRQRMHDAVDEYEPQTERSNK